MDLTMERPRPLPFEAEIILAAEARLIFFCGFSISALESVSNSPERGYHVTAASERFSELLY